MKTICSTEFNIFPDKDITLELIALLDCIKDNSEDTTVIFNKGIYYIDSEKCKNYMLYITNTVGDKEFLPDEIPHLNAVPFYFSNINNLVFDCNDSIFIINGKVTNVAVENCKNITLKNLEIRYSHPDMHELRVVKKSSFYVDFEIDNDSLYKTKNNKLYFYGKDYCVAADKNALNAHWIGLITEKYPDRITRVSNPLLGSIKIKALNNRIIRAYYINTFRFKVGDCFYLFDVRWQFAGVFVNRSECVVLDNIKQRFNYSLALVLQDSKDISLINSEFAPEKCSARKMASVADFMQVCMCRGNIEIKNNVFSGSGDDCLNVHGIHFKIMQIIDNKLIVRFMHPQSHGYNPLRIGDEIAFINSKNLLEHGRTIIKKSVLINEYEIELEVESVKNAVTGEVIEDVSACPDVHFAGNTLNRIITRGLLFTTRGKVIVENNHFKSNSMSGILLSDDAKNWYESGMCCDVTIQNNTFDYCGKTPVLIKPENSVCDGAVHKNIKILNNHFINYNGYAIRAKSSKNILVQNNKYNSKKIIKTVKCKNVCSEDGI